MLSSDRKVVCVGSAGGTLYTVNLVSMVCVGSADGLYAVNA